MSATPLVFSSQALGRTGVGTDSDFARHGNLYTSPSGKPWVACLTPAGYQMPDPNVPKDPPLIPAVSGAALSVQPDGSTQCRNVADPDTYEPGPYETCAFDGSTLTTSSTTVMTPSPDYNTAGAVRLAKVAPNF